MARLTHVTWHVQVHARSARAALLLSVRVRVCASCVRAYGGAGAWGGPAGVGEAAATAAGGGDVVCACWYRCDTYLLVPHQQAAPKPGLSPSRARPAVKAWLRIWQAEPEQAGPSPGFGAEPGRAHH
ncbi:hypothetical protein JB92DRAFT_3078102 [Gautieria morchelliformis]|nr:hypothetical protein JB92DRAFT_3078102 [Gautieria morchelliformis]